MERELTLRIVLKEPLAGVDFAVQEGRGAGYQTVQRQRSTGKDLLFEFGVIVKDRGRQASPDFDSPVVQGQPGERFIYIDIGTFAGQTDTPWSRRLKVPLSGISWDMVDRTRANARTVLETQVPGTGRDGGPNCATVKPFDGWKLAK